MEKSGALSDEEALRAQLGRPLRAESVPVKRCSLQLPIVIAVPPVLENGEPFPTRYWLTCPLAHKRIARLESAGAVKEYEERRKTDASFSEALDQAHAAYAQERDALVQGDVAIKPRGGVAGVAGGVKCLHAHFAHAAAGGTNPIGEEVRLQIAPLECSVPCVALVEGMPKRNPAWSEPKQGHSS